MLNYSVAELRFIYYVINVDIILISQIYGIKMISQGQKIKISNTLTEKGRWDDTQRPFPKFSSIYI